MEFQEPVKLTRDCEAVQVPSGNMVTVPAGTEVRITQALGGSYTVITDLGYMATISGKNADALGLEAVKPDSDSAADKTVEELVWAQLKTCYDPEIPYNIVDLGLIYDCNIQPDENGKYTVEIRMTLTAPGCGMGDYLRQDVMTKLLHIKGVRDAVVEVVFDPPWDMSKMNPAIRRKLNMT